VGATYAYTPEAYPTNLRATGMGAASAWARIAGAIAPSLGAALSSGHFDLVVPLTVFAVAFVIAGLAALGLPRETASLPLADSLSAIGGNGTRADARQASYWQSVLAGDPDLYRARRSLVAKGFPGLTIKSIFSEMLC
jgi:hypothetical protein